MRSDSWLPHLYTIKRYQALHTSVRPLSVHLYCQSDSAIKRRVCIIFFNPSSSALLNKHLLVSYSNCEYTIRTHQHLLINSKVPAKLYFLTKTSCLKDVISKYLVYNNPNIMDLEMLCRHLWGGGGLLLPRQTILREDFGFWFLFFKKMLMSKQAGVVLFH